MSEPGPGPHDQIVPLQERSVIHVSPEEVMQPDRQRGPFRDVSLDSRVVQIMLASSLMVGALLGGFALLAVVFKLF